MMPNGDTVGVLRSQGRDKFGDVSLDLHHEIHGVGIDWSSTDTTNSGEVENRAAVVSNVVMYCPVGTDILASDRVELPDGDTYRVVGKPAPWKNPMTGWSAGVVVKLQRIEG